MPTPMWVYADAAEKFGGVDKTDEKAVERFFVEDMPNLPPKKREKVVRYLLQGEGLPALKPGTPSNDEDYNVQLEMVAAEMIQFVEANASLDDSFDITTVSSMTEFHFRGMKAYCRDEEYSVFGMTAPEIQGVAPTWEVGWLVAAILDHDDNTDQAADPLIS